MTTQKTKILCFLSVVCILFLSGDLFAKKTTYVYTDRRFNFVKRVELDKKEKKELQATHPTIFTEAQMHHILKNIRLNQRLVLSKEVYSQDVFDERALRFLTPKLMKAFSEVTSDEKIVVSYLDKNPIVILRNDRLTIMEVWVSNKKEFHIQFNKLMAKLLGDTDKRGTDNRIINEAKGIRVSLETNATQELGNSSDELIVHLDKAFAEQEALSKIPVTNASAKGAPAPENRTVIKLSTEDAGKRLKKLEKLKKKDLITEEEYQEKRQEILNSL